MTGGGTERWRFATGWAVGSSPTVVDDTVYVRSDDDRLYAVDARDGTGRWQFETTALETNGTLVDAPAVADGTVYVGSGDGHLSAVDAAEGTERWRFDAGDHVISAPTVREGTVYVAGADPHRLYAVDARDGTERWQFEVTGARSPTVVDDTVYVGTQNGDLYAVDARDGTERWRFDTGDSVVSCPTVRDGTVYAGTLDYGSSPDRGGPDGNLCAVDATEGTERWRLSIDDGVLSSPTARDGTVYVGSRAGRLYAVDARDGTERWRFRTAHRLYETPVGTALHRAAGYLSVNYSFTNPLAGLHRRLRAGINSSPTVAGDTVYVGSDAGSLHAVDARDGTERWQFRTDGSISSSPTVVDGTAYVGSDDHGLYAVDTGDGATSDGSRVRLGTIGHHDRRATADPADR